jgi:RNA polymerase sigma-70 factor (ECF subfamily)
MLAASKSVIEVEWPEGMLDAEPLDDLVVASRRGNRKAQQRLYECCHRRVYRLLVRMVGQNDADDLLQQVFLQVFRSLGQFSGHSRFETWLYRVSVNESLQHLRKQRRRRWVSLEGDFMDRQPDQERDFDHKELMEHALARLEPELRSLFLLREVEKQSYAEIAAAMQIPEGTVASRLSRARQLLKQYLVELGWEP